MLLLVDDEEGLRRGLAVYLRHRGLSLREAGGLAEALALAGKHRPGWVVTDLKMADGSGLDLAAWLAARSWPSRVVLMTGYAGGSLLEGAPPTGVDLVLEKPVRPDLLVEKLASLGLRGGAPVGTASPPRRGEEGESRAARARRELRQALWASDGVWR